MSCQFTKTASAIIDLQFNVNSHNYVNILAEGNWFYLINLESETLLSSNLKECSESVMHLNQIEDILIGFNQISPNENVLSMFEI